MKLAKLDLLVQILGERPTSPGAQRDHRAAIAMCNACEVLKRELTRIQLTGLIDFRERDALIEQFEAQCTELLKRRGVR